MLHGHTPQREPMTALVLADQLLQRYAQCELLPRDTAGAADVQVKAQFARAA